MAIDVRWRGTDGGGRVTDGGGRVTDGGWRSTFVNGGKKNCPLQSERDGAWLATKSAAAAPRLPDAPPCPPRPAAAAGAMSSGTPPQSQNPQTRSCGPVARPQTSYIMSQTVHHRPCASDTAAQRGTCSGCHRVRMSADTPPIALRRASGAPGHMNEHGRVGTCAWAWAAFFAPSLRRFRTGSVAVHGAPGPARGQPTVRATAGVGLSGYGPVACWAVSHPHPHPGPPPRCPPLLLSQRLTSQWTAPHDIRHLPRWGASNTVGADRRWGRTQRGRGCGAGGHAPAPTRRDLTREPPPPPPPPPPAGGGGAWGLCTAESREAHTNHFPHDVSIHRTPSPDHPGPIGARPQTTSQSVLGGRTVWMVSHGH